MIDGIAARTGYRPSRCSAELRRLRGADLPTHGGRLFAYVYDPAVPGLDELAAAAHALRARTSTGSTRPPSRPCWRWRTRWSARPAGLLGGGPGTTAPDVVGSVTSGGTESLILAVKAARDAHPEIAAPADRGRRSTAHAAFAKAAHYLRVALDVGAGRPGDPARRPGRDGRRDPPGDGAGGLLRAVVRARGGRPGRARSRRPRPSAGVRCHVDACFGGWTLPYLRRLGVPVPRVRLRGARASPRISVDLHKYAYAPKGVSVLLHRDAALRAPAVLRVRRLARLHDGQPGDRVHPLGRPDRRRVRHAAAPRRRRLPAAGRASPGTRSPAWPTRSAPSTGCG